MVVGVHPAAFGSHCMLIAAASGLLRGRLAQTGRDLTRVPTQVSVEMDMCPSLAPAASWETLSRTFTLGAPGSQLGVGSNSSGFTQTVCVPFPQTEARIQIGVVRHASTSCERRGRLPCVPYSKDLKPPRHLHRERIKGQEKAEGVGRERWRRGGVQIDWERGAPVWGFTDD